MIILKAPFFAGGLGKTKGCEKAPDKIVEALNEIYLNENLRVGENKVKAISVDNFNIEASFRLIEEAVSSVEEMPIIIGGDHSITYASFRAFAKKFNNPGILVFDAHPDLENDFFPPTHEDYLRRLISEKLVKPENVILAGVRNASQNEVQAINLLGVRTFWMKSCYVLGMPRLADMIMENCRNCDALYISIDIDAFDPAFAPGTGYIEPGGFSSREFFYLIQRVLNLKNIRAFDIVEINPDKDINSMTVTLGAKIVSELSGYGNSLLQNQ